MKLLKLSFAILLLLTITSCVSSLPLNQQFYNTKKVGIILQVDSIGVAKAGSQGLLDMALTQGVRFKEPLKKVESNIELTQPLKNEISYFLNFKNKQFVFIDEKLDYKALKDFEKPSSDKKYSKKDFRNYKASHNVDEILYVKVRHGILVSYYGVIETGKQGYCNIESEVIDLEDNSLLQKETLQTMADIKGNWKDGDDYANLKEAIQAAINSSIASLKYKF
ncbi:hypothetical protein OX284_009380 [Flavobacterium sp. SUN046]|uniref:hypothetical protein n=1 Tax=Flavobacterium sp. SUN046 TaxID=3002440 RepID=UPI002DB68F59|nr:hypothetical protein [Flavobacterium sp. SUN046]MEC4049638.1 hypothetical protein [Flavobacterium sp. SUN046]